MNGNQLLKVYGVMYGPEAGPWNLSKENLYIGYLFRKFYEDNFKCAENIKVCNVGIGAGEWDRYLSYWVGSKGKLTSINIDEKACDQLITRLKNEENPNYVEVICKDVNIINDRNDFYDILTIGGSTRTESGKYEETLNSCVKMLKHGGELFYNTLDRKETMNDFIQYSVKNGLVIENYYFEKIDNIPVRSWKARKI